MQGARRDDAELRVCAFPVAEFKAVAGEPPGTFEAAVAVFGNIDSDGDRLVKGAFARTLQERGAPPVVWSHNWDVPPIGKTLEARETDKWLRIKGRLLVADDEDHPVARQVHAAWKAGALREFSFGYRVREARMVEVDAKTLPPELQWTGGKIRELLDVELFEVGPTLVGANSETRLLGVKAARGVADRALERRREQPTQLHPVVAARLADLSGLRPPIAL